MTTGSYHPVWKRARKAAWVDRPELSSTTLYGLRHAAATMMLRAGVPPAEVARRLGHSIDVLLRVYAGVLVEERDRSPPMPFLTPNRPRESEETRTPTRFVVAGVRHLGTSEAPLTRRVSGVGWRACAPIALNVWGRPPE